VRVCWGSFVGGTAEPMTGRDCLAIRAR
jgi:hypothetical protein